MTVPVGGPLKALLAFGPLPAMKLGAIGYGAGWWLDQRFGTEPYLQIVGFLLGAAGGLVQLLQLANKDDD